MPLRVLLVGPFPRSATHIDGGVAAATINLSQGLARVPDIELVGVRLGGRSRGTQDVANFAWPVIDLPLGRFSVSTRFRRQRKAFESIVRQVDPDVIHAQGADLSGYLAVRSGRPALVTIHGILTECARLRTNAIARFREYAQARITERYVIERASNIVAISPYVSRYYGGRLRSVIHDIPNAVSPEYFGVPRRPVAGRLLFAGRLSKGKGVADLVRAVAVTAGTIRRLVLAGSSPDPAFEHQLRSLIRELKASDRVELPGLLDENGLLAEFSRASALILPSYQETAPMVIQQAMAAGLPVVATDVGGIPDLLEHDVSGLLFQPGDVNALVRLLSRLDTERDLAGRLVLAARRIAARSFTAESVAAATRLAYQDVLGSHA